MLGVHKGSSLIKNSLTRRERVCIDKRARSIFFTSKIIDSKKSHRVWDDLDIMNVFYVSYLSRTFMILLSHTTFVVGYVSSVLRC